tara:strand:- start:24761 stop:25090 length:330 start_codon:yes stop_codon:yes gene_type:complete
MVSIPTEHQLANGLREVVKEINRGLYLLDVTDGIKVLMPREIQVSASVAITDEAIIVEGLSTSVVGGATNTTTEESTQVRDDEGEATTVGSVYNIQGGSNKSVTEDEFK